jgi:Icc protein
MPIHLPPISRRGFLKGSLASASGLLFSERIVQAADSAETSTWALISDTHVAADPATISRKVNMADNLRKAVAEIIALPKKPAAVLVSGDCAFLTGKPDDYATLRSIIKPMREAGLPVSLLMGNHDDRENFHGAFPDHAPSPVDDHFCGVIKSKMVNWFLLDSLEVTNKTPGILGEAQLTWLAQQLDANADKTALIIVHHNVLVPLNPLALKDSEALIKILRPRKHAKAVFFGHTHTWEIKPDESGIHLINLPACAYTFKDPQPNGWVHATLNATGIKLQLHAHDAAHPLAGEVKELAWRA